MRARSSAPSPASAADWDRKIPVSPHCPHILQRRLQRFVTRSWTNVGIGRLSARGAARCAMTSARPAFMRPRCRRAKPASRRPRRKLMGARSAAVEVDHAGERPPTDGAEGHLVAREHDAVLLRPVVALRLVERALEGTDAAGVLVGAE